MRALSLTAPQYAVLASLEREPGASNAELARRAFVTAQSMQAMLAPLERRGLIARPPDETHGRIRRTELTEEGRDLLAEAHGIAGVAERAMREAVHPFDPDEIAAMLNRCAERLG